MSACIGDPAAPGRLTHATLQSPHGYIAPMVDLVHHKFWRVTRPVHCRMFLGRTHGVQGLGSCHIAPRLDETFIIHTGGRRVHCMSCADHPDTRNQDANGARM